MAEICRFAVEESATYVGNGFDSVIVENHWDLPFLKPGQHGYEVAAAMGVITAAVVAELGPSVGVSVLSNAGQCSVASAWAAGASVRPQKAAIRCVDEIPTSRRNGPAAPTPSAPDPTASGVPWAMPVIV